MKLNSKIVLSLVSSMLFCNEVSASLSETELTTSDRKSQGPVRMSKYQRPDRSLLRNALQVEDNLPKKMSAAPERRPHVERSSS